MLSILRTLVRFRWLINYFVFLSLACMISDKEGRPINPRVTAYGVNVGPRESER